MATLIIIDDVLNTPDLIDRVVRMGKDAKYNHIHVFSSGEKFIQTMSEGMIDWQEITVILLDHYFYNAADFTDGLDVYKFVVQNREELKNHIYGIDISHQEYLNTDNQFGPILLTDAELFKEVLSVDNLNRKRITPTKPNLTKGLLSFLF